MTNLVGQAYRFAYNGKPREAFVLGSGNAKRGGHLYHRCWCRLSGGIRTFVADKIEFSGQSFLLGPLTHPEEWPDESIEMLDTVMAS